MSNQDDEGVISEFLGDTPRAQEWHALHQALTERLSALRIERDRERVQDPDSQNIAAMNAQIGTLRKQIATLKTEEVISGFVEDSLRVALAKSAADHDDGE